MRDACCTIQTASASWCEQAELKNSFLQEGPPAHDIGLPESEDSEVASIQEMPASDRIFADAFRDAWVDGDEARWLLVQA